MSILRKSLAPESAQHTELVGKLADELRFETPTGPRILEEEQRGGYFHVTVIWDEWEGVEGEERGRIIMDAYEQERASDVMKITIALGLTSEEAQRLGIRFSS